MPEIGEGKDGQMCQGTVGNPGVKAGKGNR